MTLVPRLLVLDDSAADAELLLASLRAAGFEARLEVVATRERFDRLDLAAYDLVLADYNLGGWSALDALGTLRAAGLDTPLIVVTGSLGDEAAVDCLQRGAADYVLKERLERLPLAIRRALEEHEVRLHANELQRALLRSKLHWETTFDTVPYPILVLDAGCRIRRANRAAALLAGRNLPALIGAVCREVMGLPPGACENCPWTRMRRSGCPERGDVTVGDRVFDVSVTPYEGPGDLEDCAVQVMTDITARVAAEHAVRDSEERYRLLFETNPHPMWVFDPETLRFMAVNDAAVRNYGYSRNEFMEMTIGNIRTAADAAELRQQMEDARTRLAGEHVLFSGSMRHVRRDGAVLEVEATWSRTNFQGRPAVLVLAQDVTERVRAAAALRESEERFRELFELAPIAYHEIDRLGLVRRVNRAECELLGRSAAEMLGHPVWERVVEEEREISRQAVLRKLARGEADPPFRRRVVRPDGSIIVVENYEKIIRDSAGRVVGTRTALLDITERERAAEALRRSEARLAEAQRRAHLGHWQRDLCSSVTEWSDVIYEIYGVDPAAFEPTLEAVQRTTHPDDYARVRETVARALETGEMQTVDHRIIRGDGEQRTVHVQMVVEQEGGQPARLAGTIQDVTERRRAEEALRESEQRYRQIVETAGEGICLIGTDERVSFVNHRLADMLRCPPEELLGRPLCDRMDPASRELARLKCQGAEQEAEHDFRLLRGDGSELWVMIAASPILDRSGARTGTLAMLTDITERKRAADALRKSEERFRELFENANDIVFTHDLEGCVTSFNKAGERITGYRREEMMGRPMRELIVPEYRDLAAGMMQRKLEGTSQTAYELEIVSRDQRHIPLEISTRLIYEGGCAVGVQGIARDVTERRQLEEQLRQSQKMEAVGRLAGGIAHDFNNVLTVMKGYSDILLDASDLPERLRRASEQIHKAADRASGMTRQLLAFSRRQVLQFTLLDLREIVTTMQKMLHRLIGDDIQLNVGFGPVVGAVRADRTQIEQVLMNLAVNARDAMLKGGTLLIEARNVEISGSAGRKDVVEAGRYVLLSVSDTGCGMDPETQSRIFEPFFTTKEVGKGTGLGLATVYGIVRQSGGFISVHSEPQNGTTFKIYLPRIEGSATAAEETRAPAAARGGSETILLVEDETTVRRLVLSILEARGYRVLEAECGPDALLLSDNCSDEIHLLLTDVVMPRMSGTEVAAELCKRRSSLRVLFMSGYTDDAFVHQGTLSPGSGFLQKPFTSDVLARKVREVLDEPFIVPAAS